MLLFVTQAFCVTIVRICFLVYNQWRSEAKCRPEPTITFPPFSPLKFSCKNSKWKKTIFRAYLKI